MKASGVIYSLVLTVASGAVAVQAQGTSVVAVSQTANHLQVTVGKPISLREVLDQFCSQTNAQCLGTQQAGGIVVSPQVFVGDWRKVVATVLDGADLNYVVGLTPGSPVGTLEILGAVSAPEQRATTGRAGRNGPAQVVGEAESELLGHESTTELILQRRLLSKRMLLHRTRLRR